MAGCSEVFMEARSNARFGAVVLAARMSSRMGEAKQLLRLGENTLLGQVLENVRTSRAKDIVLVLGHEAEKIKERISTGNLTAVVPWPPEPGGTPSVVTTVQGTLLPLI
jgi:CTP:molybdopterin cytidylyltransferase MocA